MPEADLRQLLSKLTNQEAEALVYDWRAWARPAQIMPAGEWSTWLVLAGRGFGKTRTGAEAVREVVEASTSGSKKKSDLRIALVAPTAKDARDVMVEGESGILAISPSWMRPEYEPSKTKLTWPNGAQAFTYSGEEPDRLRGPQHHFAWTDEIAAWKRQGDTWDNLQMGMRLGDKVQTVVTTTPRPQMLIRELRKDPTTLVTSGSTFDNSKNLPKKFLDRLIAKYAGTRLGRQELEAELLDDVPGALWSLKMIDECRVNEDAVPAMNGIVIAIDPAVTSTEGSDDTGIMVIGMGIDGHGYVLQDLSCHLTPIEWAHRAVNAFHHWKAAGIVAETNNGGDLVQAMIATVDPRVPFRKVHATRGKYVRAEPISMLYEQKRIHHVRRKETPNEFADLENQMVSFVPGNLDKSPDRVDALVWGAWLLFVEPQTTTRTIVYEDRVHISRF